MNKDFNKLNDGVMYQITKSNNPKFINKLFEIKHIVWHHNLDIKIIIYGGGEGMNFVCGFREDERTQSFTKFWNDNQIEYKLAKEYGKSLIKHYKSLINDVKIKYGIKGE